jgi:hypothetical protein
MRRSERRVVPDATVQGAMFPNLLETPALNAPLTARPGYTPERAFLPSPQCTPATPPLYGSTAAGDV